MFKKLCPPLLVLFFVFFGCEKDTLEDNLIQTNNSNIEIENQLLDLVNTHRSSVDMLLLKNSDIAKEHAKEHNIYMILKGELSHDNFPDRAEKISQETNASYIAENVARNYQNANEAFNEWLESSGHKQNIEGDYTHTGISVRTDTKGNYYFTQIFYR